MNNSGFTWEAKENNWEWLIILLLLFAIFISIKIFV